MNGDYARIAINLDYSG